MLLSNVFKNKNYTVKIFNLKMDCGNIFGSLGTVLSIAMNAVIPGPFSSVVYASIFVFICTLINSRKYFFLHILTSFSTSLILSLVFRMSFLLLHYNNQEYLSSIGLERFSVIALLLLFFLFILLFSNLNLWQKRSATGLALGICFIILDISLIAQMYNPSGVRLSIYRIVFDYLIYTKNPIVLGTILDVFCLYLVVIAIFDVLQCLFNNPNANPRNRNIGGRRNITPVFYSERRRSSIFLEFTAMLTSARNSL